MINGKYECGASTIQQLLMLISGYVHYGASCYIHRFDHDGVHDVVTRHPEGFDTTLVVDKKNYEYYINHYCV